MSENKQEALELFADTEDQEELLLEEDSAVPPSEETAEPRTVCFEAGDFARDYMAAGRFLHDRRKNLGITLEAVEAETKIKTAHLKALESGDLGDLPQPVHPVYIVACVKKLGMMYDLDAATLDGITEGLKKQILCQAPDDVSKSCYGHEISEESLRKQRRLLLLLAAGAAAVLLLIAAAVIIVFTVFFRKTDPALKTPFDKEMLPLIQPEPKLSLTPLPVVED